MRLVENKKSEYPIMFTVMFMGMLLVGSYQGVAFSFLDELLVLVLMAYLIFRFRGTVRIKQSFLLATATYLGLALATAFIRIPYDASTLEIFFSELLNNLKPLIILLLFSMIEISTEYRDFIFKGFLIGNIPSVIMSIYQYFGREQGYALGLKMRNEMGRISGFAGHPINYAYILVSMILILLYFNSLKAATKKQNAAFYLISAGLFFLLLYTQSRYPLLLLFLVVILTTILKRKNMTRVIAFTTLCFVSIIVIIMLFPSFTLFFEGEANSVRMIGIQTGLKSLLTFPALGSGLGTFGTESSFRLNSYVYKLFDVNYNAQRTTNLSSGQFFEAGLFQKITENGLLGTFAYYYIMLYYLWKSIRKKSLFDFGMIIIFIFNSIFNTLYQLPNIFFAGIAISHLNYISKKPERT